MASLGDNGSSNRVLCLCASRGFPFKPIHFITAFQRQVTILCPSSPGTSVTSKPNRLVRQNVRGGGEVVTIRPYYRRWCLGCGNSRRWGGPTGTQIWVGPISSPLDPPQGDWTQIKMWADYLWGGGTDLHLGGSWRVDLPQVFGMPCASSRRVAFDLLKLNPKLKFQFSFTQTAC